MELGLDEIRARFQDVANFANGLIIKKIGFLVFR